MDHIVQVRIPQIKLHAPFWVRKELDKLEKLYYILKDIEKNATRGDMADYINEKGSS